MAEQSLDKLINWLKNDPLNRWEVYDVAKDAPLEKCLSFQDLNSRYTNPMDYFEELYSKGVSNVQLQRKRKNGSSFVKQGCGLNFALSTNNQQAKPNVDASGSTARPAATHQPSFPGLGSPASGLSFAETLDTYSKAKQFDELLIKYSQIESENKTLKDLNDGLKEKVLRNEFETNNKPSAFEKLLDKLAEKPDIIPAMISSIKPQANPGLNAPVPQQTLSDNKQYIVDLISNPQVPEDLSNAASHVIAQGLEENKSFMDEYLNLLKAHKLI